MKCSLRKSSPSIKLYLLYYSTVPYHYNIPLIRNLITPSKYGISLLYSSKSLSLYATVDRREYSALLVELYALPQYSMCSVCSLATKNYSETGINHVVIWWQECGVLEPESPLRKPLSEPVALVLPFARHSSARPLFFITVACNCRARSHISNTK